MLSNYYGHCEALMMCSVGTWVQVQTIDSDTGVLKKSKDEGGLRGQRVGIMAKPCAEFVAGIWATWLNGAVAVPLALSYPEAELMHVFVDSV